MDLKSGYYVIDLLDIIEHELGHLWGLADFYEKDPATGDYVSRCPGEEYGALMRGVNELSDFNKLGIGICNDDECVFKMIYCKHNPITSVPKEENNDSAQSTNYPNPFVNWTNIEFINNINSQFAQINIYNNLGSLIETINYNNITIGKNTIV